MRGMEQAVDPTCPGLPGAMHTAVTSVLRVICVLGVANASVMSVVTVIAGRTPLALAGAIAWVAVWWLLREHAYALIEHVRRRPWLLIVIGTAGVAPIAIDGGLESTLTTQALWLTWVAAVTLSSRATLAMAAAMAVVTAFALAAAGMSVDELVAGPKRFQATLLIFNPIVVAFAGLALVGVFRHILNSAGAALEAVHRGGPASTAAMTRVLHREPPRLLEAAPPEPLTDAERAVIAMLRDGLLPKQIAMKRGTSLATVRTQIKHAKRKSGARTLNDLIRRTWPPT